MSDSQNILGDLKKAAKEVQEAEVHMEECDRLLELAIVRLSKTRAGYNDALTNLRSTIDAEVADA